MNRFQKIEIEETFKASQHENLFRDLVHATSYIFEEANTPTSLALYLMIKYGEYEQYLSYKVRMDHEDSRLFFMNNQCVKLFSKYEMLPTGINTRKAAEREFIDCEMTCRAVNLQILKTGFLSLFDEKDELFVIQTAICKINSILGGDVRLNDLTYHFGPGTNVGLSKNKNSSLDKLGSSRTITKGLLALLKDNPIEHPAWDCISSNGDLPTFEVPSAALCDISSYKVVPGSKLVFISKNAKIDRPICPEPLMNSYVQTGLGGHIRKQLLKAGYDLRDQSRNQKLARVGSRTGEIATVDLSSASDTIAKMVVKEMLPPGWFELLALARSPSYTYEGHTYHFEKFSAMGCGYTFELETLLFLAVAKSCCDFRKITCDDVNVYGDDIIIPSACYDLLSRVLTKLGFRVNKEKSYAAGPFRESCGKDYFLGDPVRPLYLKKAVSFQAIMSWMNYMHRWSGPNFEDRFYLNAYNAMLKMLPLGLRNLRGPDGYGDGHLLVYNAKDLKVLKHKYRARGFSGLAFFTVREIPVKFRPRGAALFAWCLYQASKSCTDGGSSLDNEFFTRRDRSKSKIRKVFLEWKDFQYSETRVVHEDYKVLVERNIKLTPGKFWSL